MSYAVSYALVCITGKVRRINQDNFYINGEYLPEKNRGIDRIKAGSMRIPEKAGWFSWLKPEEEQPVFAIFDGMGGECAGEAAAYLACKTLSEAEKTGHRMLRRSPEKFAKNSCSKMNDAVVRYARENRYSTVGTTMCMAIPWGKGVTFANMGDSRIYMASSEEFRQISRDDVFVSAIYGKAPLTQFLGVPTDTIQISPHIRTEKVKGNEVFLLCSDGVTDLLHDKEIKKCLQSGKTPEEMTGWLLERVNERGAKDNTTILAMQISEKAR